MSQKRIPREKLTCQKRGGGGGRGRGRGGKTLHSLNIPLNASLNILLNRPVYQYSGHIELIRFKEYSRMPRGHGHISFVF